MSRVQPFVIAVWFLSGCGSSSPPVQMIEGTVPVEGTVTLDGQPLSDGRITFIDASEGRPRREYAAGIRDGKFQIHVPPGLRPVEIRAYGGEDTSEGGILPQILPARYNNRSTLSADVQEAGPNVLSFTLESKEN